MSTKLINFPRFTFHETKDDDNEEGNDEIEIIGRREEQRKLSCRRKTKIIMKELLMVKGLEFKYFKHHWEWKLIPCL